MPKSKHRNNTQSAHTHILKNPATNPIMSSRALLDFQSEAQGNLISNYHLPETNPIWAVGSSDISGAPVQRSDPFLRGACIKSGIFPSCTPVFDLAPGTHPPSPVTCRPHSPNSAYMYSTPAYSLFPSNSLAPSIPMQSQCPAPPQPLNT